MAQERPPDRVEQQELDRAIENVGYGGVLYPDAELNAQLSESELRRQHSKYSKGPEDESELAKRIELRRQASRKSRADEDRARREENAESSGGAPKRTQSLYSVESFFCTPSFRRAGYGGAPGQTEGTESFRTLSRQYSQRTGSVVDEALQYAGDDLVVNWEDNDPDNPKNWRLAYKWYLCGLATAMSLLSLMGSSAPSIAEMAISKDLHMSSEVAKFILTLFLLGLVVGPFAWAPLSEQIGRRAALLIPGVCYLVFTVQCAVSKNIPTLLMGRFLCGSFGVSAVTNAPGLFADVHDPVNRGMAMNFYSVAMFMGPSLGPMISSFLTNSFLGWRWIFWIIMIAHGSTVALAVFTMPETYGPVLLKAKAQRLRKQDPERNKRMFAPIERDKLTLSFFLSNVVTRPFTMLIVEPLLLIVTLYVSLVYALLYAFMSVIPIIFEEKRHFSITHTGLTYLAVSVGTTLGCCYHMFTQRNMQVEVEKWHGTPPPELRLKSMYPAGPILCAGLFFLGWTGNYPAVPWYVPLIALCVTSISFALVFQAALSYIVDTYVLYASSAMAANTVLRSAWAAAFPLFITQMFHNLGVQWASTLWALIGFLMIPLPFIFNRYAEAIRSHSRYAPCLDLRIKDQVMREEAIRRGDIEQGDSENGQSGEKGEKGEKGKTREKDEKDETDTPHAANEKRDSDEDSKGSE